MTNKPSDDVSKYRWIVTTIALMSAVWIVGVLVGFLFGCA